MSPFPPFSFAHFHPYSLSLRLALSQIAICLLMYHNVTKLTAAAKVGDLPHSLRLYRDQTLSVYLSRSDIGLGAHQVLDYWKTKDSIKVVDIETDEYQGFSRDPPTHAHIMGRHGTYSHVT